MAAHNKAQGATPGSGDIHPVSEVAMLAGRSPADVERWRAAGLSMLAKGQAAVVLLAGGQGTRLGSALPKGCYDIGLPSHKSLFQLQAERILRLQQLAAAGESVRIPWYIMTSEATDADTRSYFAEHGNFGLHRDQVMFFTQGMLPALTEDGKAILEAPGKVFMAPDGNGGIFAALVRCGALEHMKRTGVTCVDCYSVDNALIRPVSMPHPSSPTQHVALETLPVCRRTRCSWAGARSRVVRWQPGSQPGGTQERRQDGTRPCPLWNRTDLLVGPLQVGVFVQDSGGRLSVKEYSELGPEVGSATDASGTLLYRWANLCMQYFTVPFLDRIAHKILNEVSGPV